MKREIKFRAWVPQIKTMFHDVAIYQHGSIGMDSDTFTNLLSKDYEFDGEYVNKLNEEPESDEIVLDVLGCDGDWINIEGATLMQFTGLKDRNGKEIYEGDVVHCLKDGEPYGAIERVEFENGMFILRHRNTSLWYWLSNVSDEKEWETEFEVIGNIYENPELINQQP